MEGLGERVAVGCEAGGDEQAADQVGVDAFGLRGAPFGGADQVAELAGCATGRFGASVGVQLGRRFDQGVADGREVSRLLVLGQAFADRGLARRPSPRPGASRSAVR